jgi:hypothetical protein
LSDPDALFVRQRNAQLCSGSDKTCGRGSGNIRAEQRAEDVAVRETVWHVLKATAWLAGDYETTRASSYESGDEQRDHSKCGQQYFPETATNTGIPHGDYKESLEARKKKGARASAQERSNTPGQNN